MRHCPWSSLILPDLRWRTIAHSRLIEDLERLGYLIEKPNCGNSDRSPCMWILHFLHHSEAWRWSAARSAARSASHFVAGGIACSVRLAQLAIHTHLYSVIGCVPDLHESQPASAASLQTSGHGDGRNPSNTISIFAAFRTSESLDLTLFFNHHEPSRHRGTFAHNVSTLARL